MSKNYFPFLNDFQLLLPQRKLKDILQSNKHNTIFSDLVSTHHDRDIDDAVFSSFQLDRNVTLYSNTTVELFDFVKKFANSDILRCISLYLDISEIVNFSSVNKITLNKMTISDMKVQLKIKDLISFISFYINRKQSSVGILSNKLLICGYGEKIDKEMCNIISNYFSSLFKSEFNICLFSFSFDASVNEGIICSYFKSFESSMGKMLRSLSLEGSALGSQGIMLLNDLIQQDHLPSLNDLNLARNNATTTAITRMLNLLSYSNNKNDHYHHNHCPELHTLNISTNNCQDVVMMFLEQSTMKHPKLKHLIASNNHLDLQHEHISTLMNRNKLEFHVYETIDLSYNPLGDDRFRKLLMNCYPMKLLQNPKTRTLFQLKYCNLQNTEMGNNSSCYLANIIQQGCLSLLEVLLLGMNEIGHFGLEALLEAISRKTVPFFRHFSICLNNLGNEGASVLASRVTMSCLSMLQVLEVSDIGAGPEAVHRLARAIAVTGRMPNLKKLSIFGLQPFADKLASGLLDASFLRRVAVS